jgi:trehalose 6-phosphate synthase
VRPYSHSTLAGLYHAARVGLVTLLRDGMNLVAKEYVASQHPDDPGVLILSRFAGAEQQSSKNEGDNLPRSVPRRT